MGTPNVRVVHADDETLYRTAEVRFSGQQTIRTPGKALDLSKVTGAIPLHPAIGGINEMYRKVAVSELATYQNDMEAQRRLSEPIDRSRRKGRNRGDVNILFIECDEFRMSERDRQYLADLVYTHSDVVTVPVVRNLDKLLEGGRRLDEYLGFVRAFVQDVEQLNHKTIMGTMSPLPHAQIERLSDVYIDLGLRAVCMDFHGRSPSSVNQLNMRSLMRRLREESAEEKTVLYGINVQTGKAGRQMEPGVAPAKDVTAFGFGIDVLGHKHMGLPLPADVSRKMAAQPPSVRCFVKDDYLYRKAPLKQAGTLIPGDSVYSAGNFSQPTRRQQAEALLNMEQLGLEAVHLRHVIREDGVIAHVKAKNGFEARDLEQMRTARQGMSPGGNLDDWG